MVECFLVMVVCRLGYEFDFVDIGVVYCLNYFENEIEVYVFVVFDEDCFVFVFGYQWDQVFCQLVWLDWVVFDVDEFVGCYCQDYWIFGF